MGADDASDLIARIRSTNPVTAYNARQHTALTPAAFGAVAAEDLTATGEVVRWLNERLSSEFEPLRLSDEHLSGLEAALLWAQYDDEHGPWIQYRR